MKQITGVVFALIILPLFACGKQEPVKSPGMMTEHCKEIIGEPRVEKISDHVWLAIGYDLANVALIHTNNGNIIVDTAMSPARAKQIRDALYAKAPKARVKAIIYTHSHIDHIGGASIFQEKETSIWSTDAFPGHFMKQYGQYMQAETVRGKRQFGHNVPESQLPCSALGRRIDLSSAMEPGIRMPTHTFSGKKILEIGGLKIELIEASGETHDQLIVWIPKDKTVIAGDNFYWTFPNLYTIRGTSPRPVDSWIESIDTMRRKNPEHLVPMHTKPIHGRTEIAEALRNYRDAIQWVRDETVRGANRGDDLDALAERIQLPSHLASFHYNIEFYGHVHWSVRAIYMNALGWFDGRPDLLYPMKSDEASKREVELMGGKSKVMELAREALNKGDARWSIHLLAKLKKSGLIDADDSDLNEALAQSYEKLAGEQYNTNGRAYLLESAHELRKGLAMPPKPKLPEKLVAAIPLENIFSIMATRLKAENAIDVHETVHYVFTDTGKKFIVTIRRGVAEIVIGEPLPGTPEPVAVLTTDSLVFKKIATKMITPLSAFTSGKIKVKGSWIKFLRFMNRFERGV